jgi:hypothetical protein
MANKSVHHQIAVFTLYRDFFQAPIGGYILQQTCNIPIQTTDPNGYQFGLHPSQSVTLPQVENPACCVMT